MSISAISSSNTLDQADILQRTNPQTANPQTRAEFEQLTQALQSGNLTSARQAFGALANPAATSGLHSLQWTQDLSRLGEALQSGDLSSARQAYISVQHNLELSNSHAAHHHHPHSGGSHFLTSGFPESTGSSSSSAANQGGVSQGINLTA